ncbi:MAG: hypothetical protein Q9159_005334 [Coniocarpon cinnabarinum]
MSNQGSDRKRGGQPKTFVVEHLDPELEAWSALEYQTIDLECADDRAGFMLSSVPASLDVATKLSTRPGLNTETRGVEEIFAHCKDRVCLLDPGASQELSPDDADRFDVFLFGGILDRTSELRQKGFTGRRLGPVQMTTDTAVRAARNVVLKGMPLGDMKYVDHPEIKLDEHESTQMPFRYILGADDRPIMPNGMIELIKKDADKGFGELL